jgi:hypothetical protein
MRIFTKSFRRRFGAADAHFQLSLPNAEVFREARSAYIGLCINAGKAVLSTMMKARHTTPRGPEVVPDPERTAHRGGLTRTLVVWGGCRIAIPRPRAPAPQARVIPLPRFQWTPQRDLLSAVTLSAIAVRHPVGETHAEVGRIKNLRQKR